MAKPDYRDILQRYGQATTPEEKAAIKNELKFTEPLTAEEIDLFEYVATGYLETPVQKIPDENPYPRDGKTKLRSYVGVYYSTTQP
jgi:hypothetical protein